MRNEFDQAQVERTHTHWVYIQSEGQSILWISLRCVKTETDASFFLNYENNTHLRVIII